eukprot:203787-Prorocentrum_minimum.AAC.1
MLPPPCRLLRLGRRIRRGGPALAGPGAGGRGARGGTEAAGELSLRSELHAEGLLVWAPGERAA